MIEKFLKKWQLWLGAGFTVIVIGLIVFGVLTHSEAGLTRPTVTWQKSRFPLTVSAVAYAGPSDEAVGAAQSAIKAVNSRLGFQALTLVDGPADIYVAVGVPQESRNSSPIAYETVALKDAGGFYRVNAAVGAGGLHWNDCHIMTSNTGTSVILHQVLQHEFGHCLGLAHDDFTQSIMYPVQKEYEGFPPTFTDSDRKLLRKLYAP
jgi:predicted Zn-dependent protease